MILNYSNFLQPISGDNTNVQINTPDGNLYKIINPFNISNINIINNDIRISVGGVNKENIILSFASNLEAKNSLTLLLTQINVLKTLVPKSLNPEIKNYLDSLIEEGGLVGPTGSDGIGISDIVQDSENGFIINLNDESSYPITLPNSVGIENISDINDENIFNIFLTNGTSYSLQIPSNNGGGSNNNQIISVDINNVHDDDILEIVNMIENSLLIPNTIYYIPDRCEGGLYVRSLTSNTIEDVGYGIFKNTYINDIDNLIINNVNLEDNSGITYSYTFRGIWRSEYMYMNTIGVSPSVPEEFIYQDNDIITYNNYHYVVKNANIIMDDISGLVEDGFEFNPDSASYIDIEPRIFIQLSKYTEGAYIKVIDKVDVDLSQRESRMSEGGLILPPNVPYSMLMDVISYRYEKTGNKISKNSLEYFQWGDKNIINLYVDMQSRISVFNNRGVITGQLLNGSEMQCTDNLGSITFYCNGVDSNVNYYGDTNIHDIEIENNKGDIEIYALNDFSIDIINNTEGGIIRNNIFNNCNVHIENNQGNISFNEFIGSYNVYNNNIIIVNNLTSASINNNKFNYSDVYIENNYSQINKNNILNSNVSIKDNYDTIKDNNILNCKIKDYKNHNQSDSQIEYDVTIHSNNYIISNNRYEYTYIKHMSNMGEIINNIFNNTDTLIIVSSYSINNTEQVQGYYFTNNVINNHSYGNSGGYVLDFTYYSKSYSNKIINDRYSTFDVDIFKEVNSPYLNFNNLNYAGIVTIKLTTVDGNDNNNNTFIIEDIIGGTFGEINKKIIFYPHQTLNINNQIVNDISKILRFNKVNNLILPVEDFITIKSNNLDYIYFEKMINPIIGVHNDFSVIATDYKTY